MTWLQVVVLAIVQGLTEFLDGCVRQFYVRTIERHGWSTRFGRRPPPTPGEERGAHHEAGSERCLAELAPVHGSSPRWRVGWITRVHVWEYLIGQNGNLAPPKKETTSELVKATPTPCPRISPAASTSGPAHTSLQS